MVRAVAAAQSRAGTLTLGLFPGLIAASPLRVAITEFARRSPQVVLCLAEALPDELHRRLNARAIDLMVVTLLPKLQSRLLMQERLWDEKLVLALPSGHKFADRDDLTWPNIAALPLILKTSSVELMAYRALIDSADRKAHLVQHDVSCSTLLDMVSLGLGATIVFASGALPHPGVVFRPIAEDNATVGIDAVWPKDDRNPLRHRLLSLIREHKYDVEAGLLIPPATDPARDRD